MISDNRWTTFLSELTGVQLLTGRREAGGFFETLTRYPVTRRHVYCPENLRYHEGIIEHV